MAKNLSEKLAHIVWTVIVAFSFTFPLRIFSQITYESSDYAGVNDSFTVSNAGIFTIGSFDFSPAGAGIVWDYTSLQPVSQKSVKYINANRTGFQAAYLFSCNTQCYTPCYNNCITNGGNPLICSGSCSFSCQAGCLNDWITLYDLAEISNDSLNLLLFTVREIYNFYNSTNSGLFQVGIGAKVSNVPVMISYQNPDRVYKFPFTYGVSDSSISNYKLAVDSIPGTGLNISLEYRHSQIRRNEIEGWGTLKTPYGEFDALKMKTVIFNQDTVVTPSGTFTLNEFLPSQIIPDTVLEYKWFSKKFGIPLLKVTAWVINGTNIYQSLQYIDSLRCFNPFAVFGYLPIPAAIPDSSDSVEVNFYDFSYNANDLYWNFNDSNSTANYWEGENPSHWFTEQGLYNVELVSCNTVCPDFICDTFSLPVLILDPNPPSTAIADPLSASEVKVFPNPFENEINIINSGPGNHFLIQVFDMQGKEIKHVVGEKGYSEITIDMSRLPDEMYFLKVQTGREILFRKIIKIH